MTLEESRLGIGRRVIYKPYKNCSSKNTEYGIITSVNSRFVFVRYGSDINSKATNPVDIEFDR